MTRTPLDVVQMALSWFLYGLTLALYLVFGGFTVGILVGFIWSLLSLL
ncbi:hypothetical protein [Ferruginivarius sediminum]|nr:hypothetical protein [Ferruginivarius sediminum]